MTYNKTAVLAFAIFNTLSCTSIIADEYIPQELTYAIQSGETDLNFRLRYESAKAWSKEKSHATTLRSSVTYETGEYNQCKGKIGVIDVTSFFGQRYNPNVSDLSKPDYVTIRDPKGTGLTEAKITYTGFEATNIVFGRQFIQLDNERFYGKDDFRQFPQSFDAIAVYNSIFDGFDFMYAFVGNVNTIYGNGRSPEGRHRTRTHLFNLSWDGYMYGTLTGYVYMNKDYNIETNSTSTVGVRFASEAEKPSFMGVEYALEIANQQAKFNNPNDYSALYLHAEIGKGIEAIRGIIGFEIKGGNEDNPNESFLTPYGSNHEFNGWAEMFYTTPGRGLRDLYLKVKGRNQDLNIYFAFHYFRLDNGTTSRRAGQEIDIGLDMKLSDQVHASAAYVKYNPKNLPLDETRRIWFALVASF